MRIYQLFHALIEKFVPMDKTSTEDLQLEAVNFYNSVKAEKVHGEMTNQEIINWNAEHSEDIDFVKKPLKLLAIQHKVVGWLELWWVRYIIALLFIYLVPLIKNYIKGADEEDDDDDDDEAEEFKEFMNFRRYKKTML